MKKILSAILVAVMVAAMLLTVIPTAALAENKITITGDSVYVRKYADKTSDALGTVHKGDVYTYSNTATDSRSVTWYQISFKGSTGWVSSKYAKTGTGTTTYIYATASVNVRATNSLSGKILTTMSRGAKATYLGTSANDNRGQVWYKISYNGKTGWISGKYSSFTKPSSGSESSESMKTYGTVTATDGKTYVRTDPSLSGTILGTLKQYSSLGYLGTTQADDRGVNWYKVSFNGKVGWVSSKYTTLK